MDIELNKIYTTLGNFSGIEGIKEISNEMGELNNKLLEYRNMYRLNSYAIPKIIPEIERYNNMIESKYKEGFSKLSSSSYSVNVFASADSYQIKLENSLNKLGKIAIKKICNHYNVACDWENLNVTNGELVNYYKKALNAMSDDISDTKMGFKVNY